MLMKLMLEIGTRTCRFMPSSFCAKCRSWAKLPFFFLETEWCDPFLAGVSMSRVLVIVGSKALLSDNRSWACTDYPKLPCPERLMCS